MGLLRIVGLGFLALVLLGLAFAVINYMNQPPQPQLVTSQAVGLIYEGPPTTALAGYYCIESMNSANGYSIQLNALLSNMMWVQDSYTLMPSEGEPYFGTNVLHGDILYAPPATSPINAPCAWLIVSIENNYAYFGYSLDGQSITWFYKYPVGDATIEPGPSTELVLGGYGNGEQAVLGNGTTLVYLALYYWNGTNWAPALVSVFSPYSCTECFLTGESVNHAYIYTDGSCGGVVSWPNPVNNTICPVPAFKP
jgi:hypothetical protein